MEKKLIIDVNEKPEKLQWLLLSIQHVFAMFGATILVPLLTGFSVSVALFASGLGTLIYIYCTKTLRVSSILLIFFLYFLTCHLSYDGFFYL